MNIDDMSYEDIEQEEARIAAQKNSYRNVEKHYGSIDDMSYEDIVQEEARIAAQKNSYRNVEKHYGSIYDMNYEDIEQEEARIAAQKNSYRNIEQHYGSIEDADENTQAIMAANKAKREKEHRPSKEYLMDLIHNPTIQSQEEFEKAVLGSMQLNNIMVEFIGRINEKVLSKTFELKNIDKNDTERIQSVKGEIEQLVSVYQRYMYTLKENRWDFSNLASMKIDESVQKDLWNQQKRLDIQFDMPIPADLGEYYGGKYERDCKMVPGIELMYQDLMGKNVSWHQVINYKENELTPKQLYLKRQALKQGIIENKETLDGKEKELATLREERQQGGNVYGE